MQLRQVALVARELEPVRQTLFTLLGLDDDFADPGVGEFGLKNSVMAIGTTFLEVVVPIEAGTTAGRLLDRRGGDGGYMVLLQVDDIAPVTARTVQSGIRKIWEADRQEVSAFHVHPKDIGGAIVSFDEMRPADEWIWAGPGWRQRGSTLVSGISGVTLAASDPQAMAVSWSRVCDARPVQEGDEWVIKLDVGEIRFVGVEDDHVEGVVAVRFDAPVLAPVADAAAALGLQYTNDCVEVCGTRFQFRSV